MLGALYWVRSYLRAIAYAQAHEDQQKRSDEQEKSREESQTSMANTDSVHDDGDRQDNQGAQALRLDFVAIFTGLLVFIGALQIWTFVITERAFLAQASIEFFSGPQPVANQEFAVKFDIINSGHTTAFVFDANVTFQLVKDLPKEPEYIPNRRMDIAGPIVAGSSYRASFRDPFIMTQAIIDKIQTGDVRLFIYGFVKYRDGFAFNIFTHKTGFCAVYNPTSDPRFGMWDHCGRAEYEYGD